MNDKTDIEQAELERFEGVGYFTRIKRMCKGLGCAHDSAEYKIARLELSRLSAPIIAFVSIVLIFIVLAVMTAIDYTQKDVLKVTIATLEDDVVIDDPPDDEPEPEPIDPADVTDDIMETLAQTDAASTPMTVETVTPVVQPKTVSRIPSPVTMKAVASSGNIQSFGDGLGSSGFGTKVGGGKGQNLTGCLIGTIIDLKSKADGTANPNYNTGAFYMDAVRRLISSNFSQETLSEFFVPPVRVALTHLWVPPQPAANGPKAFGVDNLVKPSGFIVRYAGDLKSYKKGRYRLWGYFDDFMLIKLNGKVILDSGWNAGGKQGYVTQWKTTEPAAIKVKCPQPGGLLAPSDWFTIGKEASNLELIVGERPGGLVGGLLLIEEEGATYEQASDGSTILPIFCSRPLGILTKDEILNDTKYKMSVNSPRFNAPAPKADAPQKGDVSVSVEI